jgi:hypothetical protein
LSYSINSYISKLSNTILSTKYVRNYDTFYKQFIEIINEINKNDEYLYTPDIICNEQNEVNPNYQFLINLYSYLLYLLKSQNNHKKLFDNFMNHFITLFLFHNKINLAIKNITEKQSSTFASPSLSLLQSLYSLSSDLIYSSLFQKENINEYILFLSSNDNEKEDEEELTPKQQEASENEKDKKNKKSPQNHNYIYSLFHLLDTLFSSSNTTDNAAIPSSLYDQNTYFKMLNFNILSNCLNFLLFFFNKFLNKNSKIFSNYNVKIDVKSAAATSTQDDNTSSTTTTSTSTSAHASKHTQENNEEKLKVLLFLFYKKLKKYYQTYKNIETFSYQIKYFKVCLNFLEQKNIFNINKPLIKSEITNLISFSNYFSKIYLFKFFNLFHDEPQCDQAKQPKEESSKQVLKSNKKNKKQSQEESNKDKPKEEENNLNKLTSKSIESYKNKKFQILFTYIKHCESQQKHEIEKEEKNLSKSFVFSAKSIKSFNYEQFFNDFNQINQQNVSEFESFFNLFTEIYKLFFILFQINFKLVSNALFLYFINYYYLYLISKHISSSSLSSSISSLSTSFSTLLQFLIKINKYENFIFVYTKVLIYFNYLMKNNSRNVSNQSKLQFLKLFNQEIEEDIISNEQTKDENANENKSQKEELRFTLNYYSPMIYFKNYESLIYLNNPLKVNYYFFYFYKLFLFLFTKQTFFNSNLDIEKELQIEMKQILAVEETQEAKEEELDTKIYNNFFSFFITNIKNFCILNENSKFIFFVSHKFLKSVLAPIFYSKLNEFNEMEYLRQKKENEQSLYLFNPNQDYEKLNNIFSLDNNNEITMKKNTEPKQQLQLLNMKILKKLIRYKLLTYQSAFLSSSTSPSLATSSFSTYSDDDHLSFAAASAAASGASLDKLFDFNFNYQYFDDKYLNKLISESEQEDTKEESLSLLEKQLNILINSQKFETYKNSVNNYFQCMNKNESNQKEIMKLAKEIKEFELEFINLQSSQLFTSNSLSSSFASVSLSSLLSLILEIEKTKSKSKQYFQNSFYEIQKLTMAKEEQEETDKDQKEKEIKSIIFSYDILNLSKEENKQDFRQNNYINTNNFNYFQNLEIYVDVNSFLFQIKKNLNFFSHFITQITSQLNHHKSLQMEEENILNKIRKNLILKRENFLYTNLKICFENLKLFYTYFQNNFIKNKNNESIFSFFRNQIHDILQFFMDNIKTMQEDKMQIKYIDDYYTKQKKSFLLQYFEIFLFFDWKLSENIVENKKYNLNITSKIFELFLDFSITDYFQYNNKSEEQMKEKNQNQIEILQILTNSKLYEDKRIKYFYTNFILKKLLNEYQNFVKIFSDLQNQTKQKNNNIITDKLFYQSLYSFLFFLRLFNGFSNFFIHFNKNFITFFFKVFLQISKMETFFNSYFQKDQQNIKLYQSFKEFDHEFFQFFSSSSSSSSPSIISYLLQNSKQFILKLFYKLFDYLIYQNKSNYFNEKKNEKYNLKNIKLNLDMFNYLLKLNKSSEMQQDSLYMLLNNYITTTTTKEDNNEQENIFLFNKFFILLFENIFFYENYSIQKEERKEETTEDEKEIERIYNSNVNMLKKLITDFLIHKNYKMMFYFYLNFYSFLLKLKNLKK